MCRSPGDKVAECLTAGSNEEGQIVNFSAPAPSPLCCSPADSEGPPGAGSADTSQSLGGSLTPQKLPARSSAMPSIQTFLSRLVKTASITWPVIVFPPT